MQNIGLRNFASNAVRVTMKHAKYGLSLLPLFVMFACIGINAQQNSEITGFETDPAGAAIASAHVTPTLPDNASGSPQSVSLSETSVSSGGGQTGPFYVAPNGNDGWSGTLPAPNAVGTDGPFATFDRARAAVQALSKTGLHQVVVQFRSGTYFLPATVQFTAADSGSASTPIIYENYPDETPVISGGIPITGWKKSPTVAGAWQATVTGYQPFEQLWVNGQRRYRVRAAASSSSGYLYNLGPVYVSSATGCRNANYDAGYSPAMRIAAGQYAGQYQCFDRFFFTAGDINPSSSGLADPNHPIEIIDFENWTISRMRLQSIGPSSDYSGAPANSSVAYLVGATVVGPYWGFLPGHRYLIDNVKDALSASASGEWSSDVGPGKRTVITYVPVSGEDLDGNLLTVIAPQLNQRRHHRSPRSRRCHPLTVIAPQLNQLIVANDLSYVTFKGLTFSDANWVAGSPGYSNYIPGENLPNDTVPAALSFPGASHIMLDSVIVAHVGGWGVDFVGTNTNFAPSGACSSQDMSACNNQIVNSEFTDLGSGGVRLGGEPASGDTDSNVAQYNLVYNTVLAGGDRMLPGVAIYIGNSHHNAIDHDDIYDFYNMGINVGRSLDFSANNLPNWTHDNQITYNHIHQLGQGVTDDMGAVHAATALQTGNVIEYNNFHDITHDPGTGGYGGWGIYLDQGSSFWTAKYNLVYNTSQMGFTYNASESGTYQLNGTPNVIANNVFAFGAQASVHRNGDDGALNFTFENNIIYWDHVTPPRSPMHGNWYCTSTILTDCFDFKQNMYYSTTDPNMTIWRFPPGQSYTLAQWQATPSPAEDIGSTVTVDPMFVCPSAAVCPGSGAFNFNLQSGSQAPELINSQPFDASQAGRASPVLMPPPLPPAFPLQLLSSY